MNIKSKYKHANEYRIEKLNRRDSKAYMHGGH